MSDPPGRQTKTARDRRRRSWDGDSFGAMTEKDTVGLFLDDVAYVFADVSVFAIPVLYAVLVGTGLEWYGAKSSAMVAWLTMVVGGALVRGGWITPLGTDVPGWVSMTLELAVLRLVYFNATLAAAVYGGTKIVSLGPPLASVPFAFAVGALSVGLFPRIAETYCRVASRD